MLIYKKKKKKKDIIYFIWNEKNGTISWMRGRLKLWKWVLYYEWEADWSCLIHLLCELPVYLILRIWKLWKVDPQGNRELACDTWGKEARDIYLYNRNYNKCLHNFYYYATSIFLGSPWMIVRLYMNIHVALNNWIMEEAMYTKDLGIIKFIIPIIESNSMVSL
jgi:hypothetical protein